MAEVGPLTPEELLARSAANVKSGNTASNKNLSAVGKLLAERDTPLPEDVVEISPVQKILQKQTQDAEEAENYFESDDYIQLKVNQLRGQLAIYSTLPGLDPSGAIIGGIEQEIRDILASQQERLNESLAESDAAEAKLKEQEAQAALDVELVSSDDLLARVQGKSTGNGISKEAQALLDNLKGSNVDTSA